MGTHISRVKSVDLDAWTDEQLQSVLRWGNSRANKSVAYSDMKMIMDLITAGTGKPSWRRDTYHLMRMSKTLFFGIQNAKTRLERSKTSYGQNMRRNDG